jgi:hypothetical protein
MDVVLCSIVAVDTHKMCIQSKSVLAFNGCLLLIGCALVGSVPITFLLFVVTVDDCRVVRNVGL